MSVNYPDKWMIVEIKGDDPHFRVFGVWSGGYAQGDSWQLNSGIVEVVETDTHYEFIGSSGSKYICHKEMYGTTGYGAGVLETLKEKFKDKVEVLVEQPDVMTIDWIITA